MVPVTGPKILMDAPSRPLFVLVWKTYHFKSSTSHMAPVTGIFDPLGEFLYQSLFKSGYYSPDALLADETLLPQPGRGSAQNWLIRTRNYLMKKDRREKLDDFIY